MKIQTNKWKAPLTRGMLGVILCSASTGAALAGTPDGAGPQQVVEFADLNLQRQAGVALLYQRIEAAAHVVCNSSGERELAQVVRWHLCLDHSIARAVSDLSIPALTSYHMAKSGRNDVPYSVAKQP
jgi:UrcA family protein